ncbi:hypothetical protein LEMLEM_LOCUS15728, partial [Lemmus lemmus]
MHLAPPSGVDGVQGFPWPLDTCSLKSSTIIPISL